MDGRAAAKDGGTGVRANLHLRRLPRHDANDRAAGDLLCFHRLRPERFQPRDEFVLNRTWIPPRPVELAVTQADGMQLARSDRAPDGRGDPGRVRRAEVVTHQCPLGMHERSAGPDIGLDVLVQV